MLFNRRLVFILLIVVMSISSFLLIITNTVVCSMIDVKKELIYKRFGNYHAMATRLNQSQFDKLKNIKDFNKVGKIVLVNKLFQIDNNMVTFGFLDDTAKKLGHITLKSGRYPTKKNEIAIESFLCSNPDNKKVLNSYIDIKIDKSIQKFKIVGIIDNYSNNWSVVETLKMGESNYPNILLSKDNINEFNNNRLNSTALIFMDKIKKLNGSFEENEIYRYLKDIIPSQYDFQENYKLANEFTRQVSGMLRVVIIFSVILILFTIICTFKIFEIFFKDFNLKYSIFMAYGATASYIKKMLLFQGIIIFGISLGLAVIPGIIASYVFIHKIGVSSISVFNSFMFFLIWFIILTVGLILMILNYTNKLVEKSIKSNQSQNSIDSVFDLKAKYRENIFSKILIKRNSVITIIILVLINYIYFSTIELANTAKYQKNNDGLEYFLTSKSVEVSCSVNGYNIQFDEDIIFNKNLVDNIINQKGIKFVDRVTADKFTTILFAKDQQKKFFNYYLNNYKLLDSTAEEVQYIKDYWPKIPGNLTPLSSDVFDIIEVNDKEFSEICKLNNLNESNLNYKTILFLPNANKYSENEIGIKKDASIKLGRIELLKGKDMMLKDAKVEYKDWDIKIGDVINKELKLKIKNGLHRNDNIKLVIHREIYNKLNISNGYDSLNIYFEKEVPKETRKKIDYMVRSLANSNQGGIFTSEADVKEDMNYFYKFTMVMGIILTITIAVYTIIILCSLMYTKFIKKHRFYSIKRALGLNIKNVMKDFSFEFLVCYIVSIIFTFIAIYASVIDFSAVLEQIPTVFTSSLFILFVLGVSLLFPYMMFKKDSISTALKAID